MEPLDPKPPEAPDASPTGPLPSSPAQAHELVLGEPRQLAPSSIAASRLGSAISVGCLGLIALAVLLVMLLTASLSLEGRLALVGLWLGSLGALLALAWIWPKLYYRHASYRLDERGLTINRGVLWRREIRVPRSRIQHTDVAEGPIERGFGLATLILHTAGTHDAAVPLAGLERETAFALREQLLETGGDDAV